MSNSFSMVLLLLSNFQEIKDKSVLNRSHKCLLHQTYGRWHIDGRQSRERATLELPEVAANERNDAVKLVEVYLHLDSSISERKF